MELRGLTHLSLPAAALALAGCWAVGAVAGCGAAPAVVHGPVQELPLTVQEIPFPGFQVEANSPSAGFYSNRRLAGRDPAILAALRRAGREGGYERDFSRAVSPVQVVGPVVIESSASLFRTAQGAREGLALLGREVAGQGGTPISTGRVGQDTLGYVIQKQLNGVAYDSFVVLWRQDNAVAVVLVAGNAATMDVQYAVQLAQIAQLRLRAS